MLSSIFSSILLHAKNPELFLAIADAAPVKVSSMVGTIPETVFIMFQLTFAIITAAITAGSYAERMKLSSMLIFFALWHFLVYCPVAHWVWGGGFLMRWGVLDFAGGNVVHIVSGVSGVVGSMILGPRQQDNTVRTEHTELMTFIGGCLLWVGWFGFNAGSALAAGGSAGMAMLVTHISASTSAFTWMIIEWVRTGKPTVIGVVSGAITGLVIITPAAGFVDQTGAFVMGLVGAAGSYGLVMVKNSLGMDEKPNISLYPDAFGVHAIAGILGGFMTGLFANPAVAGAAGAFYQNGEQLGWQILGMLITIGWTALVTSIILLALKFTIGINAEQEVEEKMPVTQEHPLQPAMQMMPMMSPAPMMMMPNTGFYPPYAMGSNMGSA